MKSKEKIYNSKLFKGIRTLIDKLMKKIEKSIRFELMVVIGICFVISSIFYGVVRNALMSKEENAYISYDYSSVESAARDYVATIKEQEGLTLQDSKFFNEILNFTRGKGYIVDLDGNVLYKSPNAMEEKIDLFKVISSLSLEDVDSQYEKKIIFPLSIAEERCYFLYENTPNANIQYDVTYKDNGFSTMFLTCIVFVVLFIIITNRKMKYLDEIAQGLKVIANGNLSYRIEEKGKDEIKHLAYNINNMAEQISNKIESERKVEKTKADLITNVSHDLRTPLTSIMGYIGLVKDKRFESENQMKEYLDIAFNKSVKLKSLIEDLFEYTKLDNGGIKMEKIKVNLNEFLYQLTEELIPLFEENRLTLINKIGEEQLMVELDPDKMLRVFENLLTNSIKYSYKPGDVIVEVYEEDCYGIVAIKNKGDNIPQEKIEKLFERFYRLDESRNINTGGSGLGLAISKNIVELHGGEIWAESLGNDITFYVQLKKIL